MNNRVNQLVEQLQDGTATMREVLLTVPREARANEQGQRGIYILNQLVVKRYSRRYWYVGASLLRLDDAVKAVTR